MLNTISILRKGPQTKSGVMRLKRKHQNDTVHYASPSTSFQLHRFLTRETVKKRYDLRNV
jgi:hypothetical protein